MNILICCDYDNGGQMVSLFKALNRYTEHIPRLITFHQSYLNYDTDILAPDFEIVKQLVDWADFIILGELLIKTQSSEYIYKKIHSNNCILRAAGSLARKYPQYYMSGRFAHVMKTGTYHDHTIASRIFPMAHTVNMYHFDAFPIRQYKRDLPWKLVLSKTSKPEGYYDQILYAWNMLSEKYESSVIDFVEIQKIPWKESLKIKSDCDIFYDQTSLGFYGSSAVEGMFYNCPTFCYISGWCKSIHPDLPLISVLDAETITDITIKIIEDKYKLEQYRTGHDYCIRTHSAENAVVRWTSLIDYIINDFKPGVK